MKEGPVLKRRDVLKLAALAAMPGWLSACVRGPKTRVVHFFNWSNYIGKNTVPGFEKETGIQVAQDLFSDEDEMFAKLKTGVRGYDLAVVDDYLLPRMKALELIQPYPAGAIKNLSNLADRFSKPPYDPELQWTVPYLWGTTGIAFNKKFVKKAPTSWKDLFDPQFKGKISMLNNERDVIDSALLYLGLPPDTKDPAHLEKAEELLLKQRPLLKHYSSATYIDELAAGEVWIAQAWSGDALQATRENPDIDYVIPREGSFIYVSNLCLIADASARDEAISFVDYILRPEVAADITATVRYPSPNGKAQAMLPPDILGDPRIYPSRDTMKRLRFYEVLDDPTSQLWSRTWQKVKLL